MAFNIITTDNGVQIIWDTVNNVPVTTIGQGLQAGGALIALNAETLDQFMTDVGKLKALQAAGVTPTTGSATQPGGIFAQIFIDFAQVTTPPTLAMDTPYILTYRQRLGTYTNAVMFTGGLGTNGEGPVATLPIMGSPQSGVTPTAMQMVTDVRLDTDMNLQVQRQWVILPQNMIYSTNAASNWITLFPGDIDRTTMRVNFVGRTGVGTAPYHWTVNLYATTDGVTKGATLYTLDTATYNSSGVWYRLLNGLSTRVLF